MNTTLLAVLTSLSIFATGLSAQETSIVNTKHNLSISGPGPYKATIESQICIFCHTPHRARSTSPLWNREDSRQTYTTYNSSTFGGQQSQPTGASKLCLSCHDGSIALGNVVSSDIDFQMQSGHEFLDSGPGSMGTVLQDDHPVSFHYSSSKGGSGVDYLSEEAIVDPVHLDGNGMVQCTSCHDAHNNQFGSFLLTTNQKSVLCLSCHNPTEWPDTSHSQSSATWDGVGPDPWSKADYNTVTDNACANCHTSHGAGQAERLLEFAAEEQNCLKCHSGHVASKDVQSELGRVSAHVPFSTQGVHDPIEDPFSMARHAECQDCHNPHASKPGVVAAPDVPGPLNGVSGITASGQFIPRITFGYELCYKCHADNNGGVSYLTRQIQQTNSRLEFDPQNPSFHPVEAPGANPDVPSLIPPLTTSSVIACTDCHQSNTSPDAGGSGPAGPHGSNYRPLLIDRYDTQEYVQESPAAYALCYRCHSRQSILNDDTFGEHKMHILEEDAPCSACHDGHGISSSQGTSTNNTHLINFNVSYVRPSRRMGLLRFTDEGFRRGSCSLECHGEDHRNERYGD
jgi:predicted CXXCH cytochrome family protein